MTFASPVPAASRIATFTDPDLYRQAVRAVDADVVVVGSGDFRGALTKVDFERLWIQRGHETLPRIAWLKHNPARAPIFFLTRAGHGSVSDSGRDVLPGAIVFHKLGATYHSRSGGEMHWGAMSLTPEDLAAVGRAVVGRELTVPSVTCHSRPDPGLMSRLIALHDSAGQLARTRPDMFAHPEVARALEQMLLHAMVRCLADGAPVETSRGNRRHAATLARLEDVLVEKCDRPLYLAEICTAIGVSERSLRMCCQEHLGMGPIHYLWLRRMTLAHRALLRAAPASTTVTEVATGYGFWELGRFAGAYRKLFGEAPSATLAKAPQARRTSVRDPFALFD
jgi:AraC-like DNA-binding protein